MAIVFQVFKSFKTEYYTKTAWLCGFDIKRGLFCFPCLLFGREDPWTKTGVSTINHLYDRFVNKVIFLTVVDC